MFDKPIRTNLITYDNIKEIVTGQEDDYTTACFLDGNYFEKYYKMIAIDLIKKHALYTNPKAIRQISFTGNLKNQSIIFFIAEEVIETVAEFSKSTVQVFYLNKVLIWKWLSITRLM